MAVHHLSKYTTLFLMKNSLYIAELKKFCVPVYVTREYSGGMFCTKWRVRGIGRVMLSPAPRKLQLTPPTPYSAHQHLLHLGIDNRNGIPQICFHRPTSFHLVSGRLAHRPGQSGPFLLTEGRWWPSSWPVSAWGPQCGHRACLGVSIYVLKMRIHDLLLILPTCLFSLLFCPQQERTGTVYLSLFHYPNSVRSLCKLVIGTLSFPDLEAPALRVSATPLPSPSAKVRYNMD